MNFRYNNEAHTHLTPIFGVRYVDLADRFSVLVADDALSFVNAFGGTDIRRTARYSAKTENRIFGPQFGLELAGNVLPGVALTLYGKVAPSVNYAQVRFDLTRGDRLEGLNGSGRDRINFSQVYEFGLNLDVYFLERFRMRFGYQAMWLANILESTDQVDFNLANPQGRIDNSGNIFFHGPRAELQFLF